MSSLVPSLRTSPDFSSEADFRRRVLHYQNAYETVKEEEGSYIKVLRIYSLTFLSVLFSLLALLVKISIFMVSLASYEPKYQALS